MGLDSLSSVELRNRLQNIFNCKLPSTLTYDFPTINSLVNYLVEKLNVHQSDASKPLTTQEKITQLSEAEAESLLLAELENMIDTNL